MPKALEHWEVRPHGPLEQLTPQILTVTGEFNMPLTRFERRMTVVRLADGRLVIFSAIALDEKQMRVLEDFGTPAFLIVPNHLHRNDAFVFKQRFPQLVIVAPSGAKESVEEVVSVDTTEPDFGDPNVRFVSIGGTNGRDSALECQDETGITLILNDLVGHMHPDTSWFLRLAGFAGKKPRIPRVVKLGIVKDKAALRARLLAWASQPIVRIVVSHGATITSDPPGALRDMAQSL